MLKNNRVSPVEIEDLSGESIVSYESGSSPSSHDSHTTCALCKVSYDQISSYSYPMLCCGKRGCLKCLGIWFFHYGNICPFCAQSKNEADSDIEQLVHGLISNEEYFTVVMNSPPSRKINTKPLLPQTLSITSSQGIHRRQYTNDLILGNNTNTNTTTIVVLSPNRQDRSECFTSECFTSKCTFLIKVMLVLLAILLFFSILLSIYFWAPIVMRLF